MKGGSVASGFTIVETMIVLAVTSALILVAIVAVQGQTSHTEFTQAINEVESQIQQVIDSASNGNYSNTQDFDCNVLNNTVNLTNVASGNSEGTNVGCTLLGNAMQFFNAGHSYNTYTIVGLQCVVGSLPTAGNSLCTSPTTYGESTTPGSTDAGPKALAPGYHNYTNLSTDDFSVTGLENGLTAASMYYNGNTSNSIALVAFLANPDSLGTSATSGAQTGSETLGLYVINNGPAFTINPVSQVMADDIDANGFIQVNSVNLCFNSATTNQHGLITIGGDGGSGVNGQAHTVQLTISNGTCP